MHQKVYNWLRLIVLSLITMVSNISYAYDFEVDGLCYNFIGNDEVEVTYRNYEDGSYSGTLQIPETVTFNDQLFRVTAIGSSAFYHCSGLIGELIIPNSVISIGDWAFRGCSGFTGSLAIPNSVTAIGKGAFYGCGFSGTLTLSNSLTKIKKFTFGECAGFIGSLSIPNTVTTIEDYAFSGCSSLTGSLTLSNSLETIGDDAFTFCGFTGKLTIPNSVTTIGNSVFGGFTNFTELHLGNSVSSIGSFAFCCNFTGSLKIPKSLISIGESAFSFNEFTEIIVDLENSIYDSRDNCNAIIETNSNTLIAGCAYSTIPNSVSKIGNGAFWGCNFGSITSITIPNSVSSLGDGVFFQCINLEHVFSKIEHPFPISENTFEHIAFLHIPIGTQSLYEQYPNWIDSFSTIIEDLENTNSQVSPLILSIKATGNGTASYDGTTIRNKTQSFTVNEGTKATITFTPDTGYRIKSLKVNGSAKTASTSYDVTVNADTSVEVEFEAIPNDPDTPKTYTLSIRAKGNGIATYNGETIRATTKTYTLEEGTKVSMTFTPDEGNQIKSLRVNEEYQTVTDKYEGTINADTSIKIDFEEIPNPDDPDDPDNPEPPVTYTLTIKAVGNGTATYGEEVIRDKSSTFTLDEGTMGSITFTPDEGYHIKSLSINGSDISIASSYDFTMNSDTSVEVEFEVTIVDRDITIDGLNYEVNSLEDHTVTLGAGDYGLVLEVPEKVTYNDEEWTVTGIVYDALVGSEELAAVIWNPGTAFNAKVTNPNLLLYVKDEAYAPVNIKNVVVNSYASSITLTEAMSGNNFYCPVVFTAQSIEYTHNYLMKSGLNASRGWETIALPFDVQKISHSSKGEILPFAKWTSNGSAKPFWLYELSGNGFVEAESIKANTPYIISMPNNEAYPGEYQLTGRVTFSAENVEVKKSDDVQTATFGNNTFMPSYTNLGGEAGYYALNVNNDYEYYRGSANEGSMFILNLRKIHPFEAYMTSTSGTRSIDIFDGMTTGIRGIEEIGSLDKVVKVYDLSGRLIKTNTTMEAIRQELPAGVYIVNNRKMIIK